MNLLLRYFGLIIVIAVSMCMGSCHGGVNESGERPASVEFLVDLTESKTALSDILKSVQQANALIVSIEDASGSSVYDRAQLELYDFDGTFLSHPLSLLPGTYRLTEFLLVDASGRILYATPMSGSDMAHLVAEPLPISFEVAKDAVTTVRPQVLSTDSHEPEDFGYVSFEPVIVEVLEFLVATFLYDPAMGALVLTTADIEVTNESGTLLYVGDLSAITNQVNVPEGHGQYRVTINKPGYVPYSQTFTGIELAAYFDEDANGPLTVVLHRAELPPEADIVLLMHMDQGAPFIDSSGYMHAITTQGTVAVRPEEGRLGPGAYFNGNGSSLLVTPPGNELVFSGSEPFTIEAWINGTGTFVSSDHYGLMMVVAGGVLRVWLVDVLPWTWSGTAAGNVSSGWHHVALSYDGTVYRCFIDGSQTLSVAGVMTRQTNSHLRVGAYQNGVLPFFQGLIDELRIVRGTALYTSDFQIP